ncbi:hypothetical protein CPB84DRAFT_1677560 [Gymnopilus junonius]|uniref:Uncharacterized protein n=1 Tax=Gymnopilus junonius TaxID=109634 RepID=A0A9P5NSX5_GYMJU|nr:hypothetical protein CPB84DRAFT_1677560 [Gymnopilus junonius]
MSQRASSPWPAATPPPKRRRIHRQRQVIADQSQVAQAKHDCQFNSGNSVLSCFPTADTVIPQHEWASFVWNSRLPQFSQFNLVDVFLFRADSQEQILHFPQQTNPSDQAGSVSGQVNDTWFGTDGLKFNGTHTSFPFYWVVIRSDQTLDGNQIPQPIFTAVQTTILDSVATSSSLAAASASSAAAAASASSLSSLSALSSLSSASVARESSLSHSTSQPTGAVQRAASSSSFPHWAIAVIVVLGFLAIACTGILIFFIIRRIRRRQRQSSSRNSMGSASPMMPRDSNNNPDMIQRYDSAGSPLLAPAVLGGAALGAASGGGTTTHDGASTISDSGGPFSGADAAIMADAFRKMLRKPDFASAGPVEEGDSPQEGDADLHHPPTGDIMLRGELAEEGRDIRSVSSSRGVKVETQHPSPPPPPPDDS